MNKNTTFILNQTQFSVKIHFFCYVFWFSNIKIRHELLDIHIFFITENKWQEIQQNLENKCDENSSTTVSEVAYTSLRELLITSYLVNCTSHESGWYADKSEEWETQDYIYFLIEVSSDELVIALNLKENQ